MSANTEQAQNPAEIEKPAIERKKNHEVLNHKYWEILFFFSQVVMIVMYCCVVTFGEGMRTHADNEAGFNAGNAVAKETIVSYYPMWMDVHVMIFIGFGFLMTFLKTHSWGSVGINYIAAAWAIQCGMLFIGFWHMALTEASWHKINLTLNMIIEGEFCAGAFLITMGALLGKATFPQLMLIATIESVFFTLNAVVLFQVIKVVDIGGAMTIHMFGAYFGLAASFFFEPKRALEDKRGACGGNYNSQLFAMIGCVFLFMFWPSFNGILGSGMSQHRAVVNTVVSITASTLSSVYVSRILTGKIDMEVLLNATLAGGVMMGAACDLITMPGFAMLAGAIAGAISAFGFLRMNKWCQDKLGLHDTCGVHFLHGIPGTLGAIVAVVCVALAEHNFENDYQLSQYFSEYPGRSMGTQTGIQVAGIAITWAISIPAGALTGFLASRMPMPHKQFDDGENFCHAEFGDNLN